MISLGGAGASADVNRSRGHVVAVPLTNKWNSFGMIINEKDLKLLAHDLRIFTSLKSEIENLYWQVGWEKFLCAAVNIGFVSQGRDAARLRSSIFLFSDAKEDAAATRIRQRKNMTRYFRKRRPFLFE